jgi:hypothetical protein
MIVAIYEFKRGSIIAVPLDFTADDGEVLADVTGMSAWLRFAGFRPSEVTDDMPKVAEFAIEQRGNNEGWILTIDADASAALDPGFHVTDIRVGDQISPVTAIINITLPVTGGA